MKRFISLLLVLAMLPVSAFADTITPGTGPASAGGYTASNSTG